jgi:hypothetical protein
MENKIILGIFKGINVDYSVSGKSTSVGYN